MTLEIRLLVADAAPLITLAAARSLSYLLYAGIAVVIPDAVFHEATASSGKLGAEEIIDWYRANADRVRIEPTNAFQDAMILATRAGRRMPRDLGERAALEIVRETKLIDAPGDRVLLLSDDRDVERLVVIDKDRLILLTFCVNWRPRTAFNPRITFSNSCGRPAERLRNEASGTSTIRRSRTPCARCSNRPAGTDPSRHERHSSLKPYSGMPCSLP